MNSFSIALWLIIYNSFFNPLFAAIVFAIFLPVRKVRETLLHHRGIWKRLKHVKKEIHNKQMIWFHVASAGEYLMAKPVIEELIKKKCSIFISVTSISGYRWLKREAPEGVYYDFMPLDFFYNSKRAVRLMKPSALVFIRNDIWPNLRNQAVKNHIPVYFLGAPKRNALSGLKKFFYRFLYSQFTAIFTITQEAEEFHKQLNPSTEIVFTGDTKYDVVVSRKKERNIAISRPGSPCIILGSIWPEDLKVTLPVLVEFLGKNRTCSLIIAPHEITASNIDYLNSELKEFTPLLYSDFKKKKQKFKVMIVDSVGDLFYLYENSSIAYVGGGFGSGIHNIIEPAAMENVVIFGPRHEKFPEADLLIQSGSGFCVQSEEEFRKIFNELIKNPANIRKLGIKSKAAVTGQTGATQKVIKAIAKALSLK